MRCDQEHASRHQRHVSPRASPQQAGARGRTSSTRRAASRCVEDGLKEITFGEYLVEEQVLDRFQLFRALQMQDRLPGVRLGECAAALGYAPIDAIEKIYSRFLQLQTVSV